MKKSVRVICPVCAPGPYAYAGTILWTICRDCQRLLKEGTGLYCPSCRVVTPDTASGVCPLCGSRR